MAPTSRDTAIVVIWDQPPSPLSGYRMGLYNVNSHLYVVS